ncbi:sensor histidine kinase [Agromyces cerinus]|uniref:histidine kinase n=1 Tax=Agromyces cerinus subsp. cerinus TaxID=232089 RepID=A0A1N6DQX4_9MICO|nr:histidine kinase [Agromyces cerinus]SIN73192.1 Signal transduction histidine kinase [Agromyces cerinus subsp. cerinus]
MTEAPISPGYPASVVGGELRLPKPPGVIRQFWARHPWLTDSLITALYFVPTFIGTIALMFVPNPPPVWIAVAQLVAIAVAAAAILLFRRRRPWLLVVIAWLVCLVVYPFGSTDVLPLLLALYALAVYGSTRSAWIGFGGSVVVATASSYIAVWAHADDTVAPFGANAPASASQFTVLLLIATLIGVTVGNRRRYLNALIARAHDLARERDQQAQLATALERSRIAREMHDIVSHSLTVMVTLADGSAATARRDPERAAEAMQLVADTGRAALVDMRRMLGVLAEPDEASACPEELAPQPGTAGLPVLVERFRAAGLPVQLTTVGPPIVDPNLQLTVYRIVQEGLTNALRYAATAHRVEVTVEHVDGLVKVDVIDDAVVASTSELTSGGKGLVGMRERVALYGGTLEAGPSSVRGWRLHAELRDEAPTPSAPTAPPAPNTEDPA